MRAASGLASRPVWNDITATPDSMAAHTTAPGDTAAEGPGLNSLGGSRKAGWCVTSTFAPRDAASRIAATVGSSATATRVTWRDESPTVKTRPIPVFNVFFRESSEQRRFQGAYA